MGPAAGAVAWLDRRFYPQFADNWDDELFRRVVERHLTPDAQVLDVGAGDDTFPTFYRLNSPARIRAAAARCGLETVAVELVEGRPEYLRLTAPSYILGLAYERAVNLSPLLARFRVLMIVTLRKLPALD